MAQANIDLELLQETKITGRIYARESEGFHVAASDATFCHFGGVKLFYKESPRFEVEDHQQHGPNFIRSQLVTGGQNWHMLGCYISPRDVSTLESVSADIGHGPELWISLLPDISIKAWNIQTETNATRRLHHRCRWS